MLRLVVLVGVVTCSPLPDDLTPPAATATHHHHHHHHADALSHPSVADSAPHLSSAHEFSPSAHEFSSAANPSSAAHVEVTHEVRHVTFEVSEEVREGRDPGDDLTTPGDLPEDDPPIPTATTPPALPDTHQHDGHFIDDIRQPNEGHFDQGPSQDSPDIDVQSFTASPLQEEEDILGTTEPSVHSQNVPFLDVPFHNVHTHQEEAEVVHSHSSEPSEAQSEIESHVETKMGDSVVNQPRLIESDYDRLNTESVERDPIAESFEKESVERDPSSESVEHPSVESVEKYPSGESLEKYPSEESLEKYPPVVSVEKESALIESVERDLQIESANNKDESVGESVASQSYTEGDDSVNVEKHVSIGDGIISVDGVSANSDSASANSDSGHNGDEINGGEDSEISEGVNVGSSTPSDSLHHRGGEREEDGGEVIGDNVPMVDVRKEDSSEEKILIESRNLQHSHKDETNTGESEQMGKGASSNTVKDRLETTSQVEDGARGTEGKGASSTHEILRAIKAWSGAEESLEEGSDGEEEERRERKTRPEDEEIPTFIMDSMAPIDIVERSGAKKTAETLETSASEITAEVVSGEEREEETEGEGDEGDRKSRIYVEPSTLAERVGAIARTVPKILRDGLEIMSMTSPTPLTPQETQGEGVDVASGEKSPLEDDEEYESTESPNEASSEEIILSEGESNGDSKSGEGDGDSESEEGAPILDSPVSSVAPDYYTDSITGGDLLPDFSVTREDLPSLAHPHPDPPALPSNRGKSGDPTWQLPPQQEQVSVAAPASLTPGCIVAIVFGVILSIAIITGIGGFVVWQRRTLNRPKALGSDRGYAGSDSLGYLDDQVHVSYVNSQVDSTKGSPEDLISLDMDSDFFLNSLESMTIQNLWPENIRHTKL